MSESRSGMSNFSRPPWTLCKSTEFSRPGYWSGYTFPSPGDLPNPGIESRFPTLWVDSLSAEPPGKPNNTGVGSLSLLQQIFPTQKLNQGALHCRWILYHWNHYGKPKCQVYSTQNPELDRLESESESHSVVYDSL